MKTSYHRIRQGLGPCVALAFIVCTSVQAQIQFFEFTGTVENSHPWIDFDSPITSLPELDVKVGDSVTGSFVVDAEKASYVRGGNQWPSNNEFYFESVSNWSVKVNDRQIVSQADNVINSGDTVVIGGFSDHHSYWIFPLLGDDADSIAFTSPWGGVSLDDNFENASSFKLGLTINLTDSYGEIFNDANYPSHIDLDSFDFPKGFIYEYGDTGELTREGIMFNIDSFRLVKSKPRSLIQTGPNNQFVLQGDDQTLSVEMRNTAGVRYQWFFNGNEIEGARRSSLILENMQKSQSGTYMISAWNNVQTNTAIARIQVDARSHFLEPLDLNGWNADLIVEKGSDPATHVAFDCDSGKWFYEGYKEYQGGFPESGTFTSSKEKGVKYQLQPADQFNGLFLFEINDDLSKTEVNPNVTSAKLTLNSPSRFTSLAILAASGSKVGSGTVVLHFADGSQSSELSLNSYDWQVTPENEDETAIAGLYRIKGQYDSFNPDSSIEFGFGLYETIINLTDLDLDRKILKDIEFFKAPNVISTGIFAVSGQSAEIQLGTHISRPTEGASSFFETSTSIDGPWINFNGSVEEIDGYEIGVVQDNKKPNFRRTLPAELESELLAHYDFETDGRDRIDFSDAMDLNNAPIVNGVMQLNGLGWNWVGGFRARAKIKRFLYRKFTVSVDFKPLDLSSPRNNHILVGGTSGWLGFDSQEKQLSLYLDYKKTRYDFSDATLIEGEWHRLTCSVDLIDGIIRTCLNGRNLEEIFLDEGYRFEVMGTSRANTQKVFTFHNSGGDHAFLGHVDNLMVFREAFSGDEMLKLHAYMSPEVLSYGDTLSMDPVANIHLAWKSNLPKYVIQQTDSLNVPWVSAEEEVISIADQNLIPLKTNGIMKIYRLARPE